jgi:hypothetical protein
MGVGKAVRVGLGHECLLVRITVNSAKFALRSKKPFSLKVRILFFHLRLRIDIVAVTAALMTLTEGDASIERRLGTRAALVSGS